VVSRTASDFLVNRLYECGVRHIYGYPGDGVNGVVRALDRAKDKIRFVQARHE
jgi:pyruvate dehydrogenase (quinone)